MDPKCQKLIETLKTAYTLSESFDDFIECTEDDSMPYILEVDSEDGKTSVGRMTVQVNPQTKTIKIFEVVRLDQTNTYKGIGKQLILLAACKAVSLNFGLEFTATPYSESDKLFEYYNSLGLTRQGNIRGKGRNRGLTYKTNSSTLQKIISKMNGGKKTRKLNKSKSA